MTELQAARVNSLVGKNKSPEAILSPRQLALYQFIQSQPKRAWKNMIGVNIISAWNQVEKIRA